MNELTLSKNISALRKSAGLTQEALAGKLGITFQAISKWENGLSCPDLQLLPDIADIFGVSIDELFGRSLPALALAVEQPSPEPECSDACGAEKPKAGDDPAKPLPWPDDNTLYVALYCGHNLLNEDELPLEKLNRIPFEYEGPALNISSALSVTINGSVNGNVCAGGNIDCTNVSGNVSVMGDINCTRVDGSVYSAEGDVDCGDVGGKVTAGGDVDCNSVYGNVTALSSVDCNFVRGDVRSGGDVDCSGVGGSVYAGGDVDCSRVVGNVETADNLSESDEKSSPLCKNDINEIENNARHEFDSSMQSAGEIRSQLDETKNLLEKGKLKSAARSACKTGSEKAHAGNWTTIFSENNKNDIKQTIDSIVDNVDNVIDGILGKIGIQSKDKED